MVGEGTGADGTGTGARTLTGAGTRAGIGPRAGTGRCFTFGQLCRHRNRSRNRNWNRCWDRDRHGHLALEPVPEAALDQSIPCSIVVHAYPIDLHVGGECGRNVTGRRARASTTRAASTGHAAGTGSCRGTAVRT
jgi:hypothetical protein